MKKHLIRKGVELILEGLAGPEWSGDPNYEDTPRRVADFYEEMFKVAPTRLTTFKEAHDQMIVLSHHIDYTLCPHHLLPVMFDISLAYLPTKSVLGLSKLVRLVKAHFSEPITQEALTQSLADELMSRPKPSPLGAAVLVYGEHLCTKIRGPKTSGAFVTSAMRGVFLDTLAAREEFLSLVRRK